jgi:hypothetical protein
MSTLGEKTLAPVPLDHLAAHHDTGYECHEVGQGIVPHAGPPPKRLGQPARG